MRADADGIGIELQRSGVHAVSFYASAPDFQPLDRIDIVAVSESGAHFKAVVQAQTYLSVECTESLCGVTIFPSLDQGGMRLHNICKHLSVEKPFGKLPAVRTYVSFKQAAKLSANGEVTDAKSGQTIDPSVATYPCIAEIRLLLETKDNAIAKLQQEVKQLKAQLSAATAQLHAKPKAS